MQDSFRHTDVCTGSVWTLCLPVYLLMINSSWKIWPWAFFSALLTSHGIWKLTFTIVAHIYCWLVTRCGSKWITYINPLTLHYSHSLCHVLPLAAFSWSGKWDHRISNWHKANQLASTSACIQTKVGWLLTSWNSLWNTMWPIKQCIYQDLFDRWT